MWQGLQKSTIWLHKIILYLQICSFIIPDLFEITTQIFTTYAEFNT